MIEQPSPDAVVALLRDALDGDATRIEELRKTTPQQLQAARVELGGELIRSDHEAFTMEKFRAPHRPARTSRLAGWAHQRRASTLVGSLDVHRGFPADWTPYGWQFPGRPIHVNYSDDEEVNEVVFDLKDVGDFDDVGDIRRGIDEMIAKLAD